MASKATKDNRGQEMPPQESIAMAGTSSTQTMSSSLESGKRRLLEETVDEPGKVEIACQTDSFSFSFSFSDLDLEFKETIIYFWVVLLGTAGCLDVLATILPPIVRSVSTRGEHLDPLALTYSQSFLGLVQWLDNHDVSIGFSFSGIWFIDAFVDAHRKHENALRKEERRRLLEYDESFTWFWEGPSMMYYLSIALQLLLLPVGFYVSVYYLYERISQGDIDNLNNVNEEIVFDVANERGTQFTHETFTATSKMALAFAIIHHIILATTNTTITIAKTKAISFVKDVFWKLMGQAFRHPRIFRRRAKKLLAAVRWVKYLAPLYGTLNKLKGNVEDMKKKRKQYREAQKYKEIRQQLWSEKEPHVRREDAAIMLQSAWRAHYTRKAVHAFKLLRGQQKHLATLRIQRAMRRRLARARTRILLKKTELERLERLRKRKKVKLTDIEKKRMYDLQDELGNKANELLNHKLLLRPNTRFAVIWKYLFIVCVTMEIARLIFEPLLPYTDTKTKERMNMSEFVARTFIPTPVSTWEACHQPQKKGRRFPWYCQNPVSAIQERTRDLIALALAPAPVSEWQECQVKEGKTFRSRIFFWKREDPPSRWYCRESYAKIHRRYRKITDFLIEEFMLLVGIVCFLDVFITFFTGELDSNTAVLVPKPFFTRWILPGLVLQLLVNPKLDAVSGVVGSGLERAMDLGPIRVLRWSVAVVFPLMYLLYYLTAAYVTMEVPTGF
jgi:hypothetical protein